MLIHQEFNLAEDLTIAQNIFLGHEKKRGWLLDDAAMRARRRRGAARRSACRSTPTRGCGDLIVAEKQLVEIAKALARNARLLIMDEPTATLTPGETERLFALIAQLQADGVTIVYISHKLDEVERITDEVIVMRDGRFVARAPTAEPDAATQMANLMVGRELADLFPPHDAGRRRRAPRCCRCAAFSVPGWAQDVELRGARRARSSASPAWSAPAAPSCSKACWACGPCQPATVEIAGQAGDAAQPARRRATTA